MLDLILKKYLILKLPASSPDAFMSVKHTDANRLQFGSVYFHKPHRQCVCNCVFACLCLAVGSSPSYVFVLCFSCEKAKKDSHSDL